MLLSEGINLFPDKTIFFQLAIFLTVFWGLNFLVFQPILKILKLRREKTAGDMAKIVALEKEQAILLHKYEEQMNAAKREAQKEKELIRREGELAATKIIHQARVDSLEQIAKIKEEIVKASQKARHELEEKAASLSRSIGAKVLGRNLQ